MPSGVYTANLYGVDIGPMVENARRHGVKFPSGGQPGFRDVVNGWIRHEIEAEPKRVL